MRVSPSFLPLLAVAATAVSAAALTRPAEELHTDSAGNLVWTDDEAPIPSLSRPSFHDYVDEFKHAAMDGFKHIEEDIKHSLDQAKHTATGWIKEADVFVGGTQYNRLTHPSFPEYALRVSTAANSSICDSSVKTHSGYFDISDDKHLFFAFFEARHNPKNAPLALWLNGGPGCSSSTGLLFELGPCRIANGGENVENNPYSWTNKANMIFLDQPAGVGYSYTEGGGVNNTPVAAEDVYAFLQLFLQKYSEYQKNDFAIVGESYAGRYIPLIASEVHKHNKALKSESAHSTSSKVHINLESIAIGNGLTDPLTQFASVPEWDCGKDNPYRLFENGSDTCLSLEQKGKTCASLVSQCYKYDSRLTCLPAAIYCWSNLYGPAQQSGKNLYDTRKECNRDEDADGPLCYKEMSWMETWMNKPEVKKAWGANGDVNFKSCDTSINQAFLLQGDSMRDSTVVLPELIEAGVRMLIYNGLADSMCNSLGNERWVEKLETSFSKEYRSAKKEKWTSIKGKDALVKKAGKGFGNVAFVTIPEAGHMVPFDLPKEGLQMWEQWLENKPLA